MRLALALIVALAPIVALALPGAAAAENGKQLYGRYCVMCHGPNGAGVVTPATVGSGPARDQGIYGAAGPRLDDVGAMSAHFYLTTGYMPLKRPGIQPRRARQLLGPRQVDALIAYVASLGNGPPIPSPHPERGSLSEGQRLFTERCAGCHQVVGEGGYVTGAVPPPLKDATPVQVAEAVRIGPYVMPTFSKTAISDAQLDSIVRYVEWAKHPDDRGGVSLWHIGPVPEGLVTWFVAAAALIATCMLLGRRLRRG
jgi:ubiquinol-cytochrome c reductase cytochrome c subunit